MCQKTRLNARFQNTHTNLSSYFFHQRIALESSQKKKAMRSIRFLLILLLPYLCVAKESKSLRDLLRKIEDKLLSRTTTTIKIPDPRSNPKKQINTITSSNNKERKLPKEKKNKYYFKNGDIACNANRYKQCTVYGSTLPKDEIIAEAWSFSSRSAYTNIANIIFSDSTYTTGTGSVFVSPLNGSNDPLDQVFASVRFQDREAADLVSIEYDLNMQSGSPQNFYVKVVTYPPKLALSHSPSYGVSNAFSNNNNYYNANNNQNNNYQNNNYQNQNNNQNNYYNMNNNNNYQQNNNYQSNNNNNNNYSNNNNQNYNHHNWGYRALRARAGASKSNKTTQEEKEKSVGSSMKTPPETQATISQDPSSKDEVKRELKKDDKEYDYGSAYVKTDAFGLPGPDNVTAACVFDFFPVTNSNQNYGSWTSVFADASTQTMNMRITSQGAESNTVGCPATIEEMPYKSLLHSMHIVTGDETANDEGASAYLDNIRIKFRYDSVSYDFEPLSYGFYGSPYSEYVVMQNSPWTVYNPQMSKNFKFSANSFSTGSSSLYVGAGNMTDPLDRVVVLYQVENVQGAQIESISFDYLVASGGWGNSNYFSLSVYAVGPQFYGAEYTYYGNRPKEILEAEAITSTYHCRFDYYIDQSKTQFGRWETFTVNSQDTKSYTSPQTFFNCPDDIGGMPEGSAFTAIAINIGDKTTGSSGFTGKLLRFLLFFA